MTVSRIGYQRPSDCSAEEFELHCNADTGMEYALYASTDGAGYVLAACHEDVGLVTYYRADTYAAASAVMHD